MQRPSLLLLLACAAPSIHVAAEDPPTTTAATTTTTTTTTLDLPLEYSLDGGRTWSSRGALRYEASVAQRRIQSTLSEPTFTLSRRAVHALHRDALYTLRVPSVDANGTARADRPLVASVRACALLDRRETLGLHCDKTGASVALQFDHPPNGRACPSSSPPDADDAVVVTSRVSVLLHKEATPLPAQSYVLAGPQGEVQGDKPPESWLTRYQFPLILFAVWTLVIQPMIAPPERGRREDAAEEGREEPAAARDGSVAASGAAAGGDARGVNGGGAGGVRAGAARRRPRTEVAGGVT